MSPILSHSQYDEQNTYHYFKIFYQLQKKKQGKKLISLYFEINDTNLLKRP